MAIDGAAPRAASPTPVTRIALPVSVPAPSSPLRTRAAVAAPIAPIAPIAPNSTAAPSAPSARNAPIAPHAAHEPIAQPAPAAANRAGSGAGAAPIGAIGPIPRAEDREPANEALAVDPTDVAMRLQARRREREQRTRRLAWAGGLAVSAAAAAAALVALEPSWLSPRASQEVRAAMGSPGAQATTASFAGPDPTTATRPAAPPPAAATPTSPPMVTSTLPAAVTTTLPAATTTAPPAATATPTRARTAPSPADAVAATAPTKNPFPHSGGAAPNAARTGDGLRAGALARSGAHDGAPAIRAALARAHAAMPFPASTRPPHGRASTLAAAPARATTAAHVGVAASARPSAAMIAPSGSTPIPWAVAGRTASRLAAVRAGSGESGALRPLTAATSALAAERGGDGSAHALVAPIASREPMRVADAALGAPTPLAVVARPSLAADSAANAAPAAFAADVAPPADAAPIDYAARANTLMTQQVPRLAQHAERLVARTLFIAGRSERVAGDDEIRAAARAVVRDGGDELAGMPVSARESERLGEAARAEYVRRGGTPEALALQVRSFGANPRDAEAAGNLAFLLLRQRPPQAEAARQLALLAISLHGARFPEGRIEDWATLAIASALAGRERDARNAFLVTLSLAPNLERQCQAALDVYAIYGERLRAPVEAMLQAASAAGRGSAAPSCEWPRALASSALR